jgi:hypothetical protein
VAAGCSLIRTIANYTRIIHDNTNGLVKQLRCQRAAADVFFQSPRPEGAVTPLIQVMSWNCQGSQNVAMKGRGNVRKVKWKIEVAGLGCVCQDALRWEGSRLILVVTTKAAQKKGFICSKGLSRRNTADEP